MVKSASLMLIVGIVLAAASLGCLEEETPSSEFPTETSSEVAEVTEAGAESEDGKSSEALEYELTLETFNSGFFTVDKPMGWNVYPAGSCSTLAFLIRDDQEPLRQIFFFGEVGPIFMSEEQKQILYDYMSMGGYPAPYIEMPVVDPLTPQNFLEQFHLVAQTSIAQSFMPQVPSLENFQVISATPQPSFISGGQTELVRGLFMQDGKVAEGLFLVTVATITPSDIGPGGGLAYAFHFMGITSPKQEFRYTKNTLATSLQSFTLSQSYVDNCLRQQAETYAGLLKAGKTLSESSDIIMDGWESRNKVDDIISEKRSDAILGKERVYDPETGEVYEFETGFYDNYDINREAYEMNNLQLLPGNDWNLWMEPPMIGEQYLH